MKDNILKKLLSVWLLLSIVIAASSQAFAIPVGPIVEIPPPGPILDPGIPEFVDPTAITFDTNRLNLANVTDAAGQWQHSGGVLSIDGVDIADYAIVKRIQTGARTTQSSSMMTLTILFDDADGVSHNLTLQGTHNFSTGIYSGSISAASIAFSALIGASFSGDSAADTLTIDW